MPLAVPAGSCDVPARGCARSAVSRGACISSRAIIERLQSEIRAIERSGGVIPHDLASEVSPAAPCRSGTPIVQDGDIFPPRARWSSPWLLGAAEIDSRIGTTGLDPHTVHEIKPGHAIGDRAAALGFAIRLAVRRFQAAGRLSRLRTLWCTTDRMISEVGCPHAAGLLRMGLDPGALILVEAGRTADLLWAMEEGLKSRSLALAICLADSIEPVPARRLSLAAEAGATPALILTHPASAPTVSTATRWRITAQPSAPHPLDPRAPGATRFGIALERCRTRPLEVHSRFHVVEWSDETLRFRMAPGLADRAPPSDAEKECTRAKPAPRPRSTGTEAKRRA